MAIPQRVRTARSKDIDTICFLVNGGYIGPSSNPKVLGPTHRMKTRCLNKISKNYELYYKFAQRISRVAVVFSSFRAAATSGHLDFNLYIYQAGLKETVKQRNPPEQLNRLMQD